MMTRFGWILVILAIPLAAVAQEPAIRVIRGGSAARNLLQNAGFEAGGDGWTAWQKGFTLAPGAGRNGSAAVTCISADGARQYGVQQTVELNQSAATPLVIRGWSRAQDVSGSPDSNYSLYADLVYADGTPLWGQSASFRCGTHDWQTREVVIVPQKPVRSITVYCLFRGHTGSAWFDDVSLQEVRSPAGAMLYQGATVAAPAEASGVKRAGRERARGTKPGARVQTADGLSLSISQTGAATLGLRGLEVVSRTPSGFLARDVAAGSDFYPLRADGACPALGLKVQSTLEGHAGHIAVRGTLAPYASRLTPGKDRAITLVFALPLDAKGWRWGDDIRRSRVISGQEEYSNTVSVGCGATGQMSLYPLGAIWNERVGLAIANDMAHPAICRIAYHAGMKQLLIAYDFGLTPERPSADFRFVIYPFNPREGFRSAFQKLAHVFPTYFQVRSKDQGIWMPFTDVSTVRGWQDFGFRYHEGDNSVAWDDANGILPFRYTEPMTWWMPMAKGTPRTESEALKQRDALAAGPDAESRRMAEVTKPAAMYDEEGHPALRFENAPWCDGAVWSLNPNPRLPGDPNEATVYWNEAVKRRLYGDEAKAKLAGEYLDSLEGYVTTDLNYRRDHFQYSTVPLAFSTETKQPALYKGLAVFEFEKWMADDVHRMGKLMFANGVPYRYTFLCPWLDVMGTETDWQRDGRWAPVSVDQTDLWRTMAGAKPYLLLMNTNFETFTPEMVERYFQRALFYGMYPSMFSHNAADNPYWQNPKWYDRDRPLFLKYQPIIRQVAEAGWQPETLARSDNNTVLVERFGPAADGSTYFTLMNDSDRQQEITLRLDRTALGHKLTASATDLVSGRPILIRGEELRIAVPAGQTTALKVSP